MQTDASNSRFTSQSFGSSVNSDISKKYGGMIETSLHKKTIRNCLQLFSYIHNVTPKMLLVKNVVSFLRLLQLAIPFLQPNEQNLWGSTSSQAYQTISWLTVVDTYIPVTYLHQYWMIILIIFAAIKIIMLSTFFISAKVYSDTAVLPSFITNALSIYQNTIGILLEAPCFNAMGHLLGKMIFDKDVSQIIPKIVLIVINLIFSYGNYALFIELDQSTLQFHAFSLQTVLGLPQDIIFIIEFSLHFSIGLSSVDSTYSTYLIVPLLIIQYVILYMTSYIHGGFIRKFVSITVKGIALAGVIVTVINCIVIFTVGSIGLIVLWIAIAVIIFGMASSYFIEQSRENRILIKLDNIMDSPEEYSTEDMFKSPNSLVNACVIGFATCHPLCIDWTLFRNGIEIWPKSVTLWMIFAKFVAIYPNESSLLTWIFHSIKQHKLKGQTVTGIKQNIISIMRQRESTLTPELKNKIAVLTRSTTRAKQKLRHVWDAVIQGNTGEIEEMSKISIETNEQIDADFLHLLRQFPNNRFVTRAYYVFLHEVAADQEKAGVYQEYSKQLGRGINVMRDEPHELGMMAFPTIPDILSKENINRAGMDTTLQITVTEDIIDNGDDAKNEAEIEQTMVLKKKLATITVPTTRNLVIVRLIIFLGMYLAPFLYFYITAFSFSSSLNSNMEILNTITILRNYNSMTPLLVEWYVYERMGVVPDPGFDKMDHPLISLENATDSYTICNVILQLLAANVQLLEVAIGEFKTTTTSTAYAYQLLSGEVINFSLYTTLDDIHYVQMSVQQVLLNMVQSASPLTNTSLSDDEIADMRKTSVILNPMVGSLEVNNVLNEVTTILIQYIRSYHKSVLKKDTILIIAFCIVFILVQLIYQILEIKFLVAVKIETYKSLVALPKNVVSQIAESMRTLKKDSQSELTNQDIPSDINKQEENIIKVLATSGSNAAASDVIIFITSIVIETAMFCVSIYFMISHSDGITDAYVRMAPHINYFVGSFSMRVGATFNLFNLAIDQDGNDDIAIFHNKSYWYEVGPVYLERSSQYNLQSRFGGEDGTEYPYKAYVEASEAAYGLSSCEEEVSHRGITDFFKYVGCYDAESIMLIHQYYIMYGYQMDNYSYLVIDENKYPGMTKLRISDNVDMFQRIYFMLIYCLYDEFYYRNFNTIVPEIKSEFAIITEESCIIGAVLAVVALICEIVHIWRILFIQQHIRDVLKLLLHAPVANVFQTPKIVKVLSGDFSGNKNEMTNRNEKFFNDVLEAIPDVILIAKTDFTIFACNSCCSRLLNKEKEDIIGKTVSTVFQELEMDGNLSLLTPTQNQSEVLRTEAHFKKGTDTVFVIIELSHVNNNLVYTIRDNTQTVRYNTLIAEERAKSDAMLASILPKSLVSRVQAGEKNISFSVQSATVLFLDIVSFTPWCGSHDAKTVMDTLNLFFKKLDAKVAEYPTMTKIKCIGDCYMCAGGIFMEVNQPTEHAREVVSFGLDALDALQEVNKEMNQELQIRVGINSGGPLVAGVLGVGKPTFEILGPTINMAQQMEHHGVPSKVHISRSVYELIYGNTFIIKERGTVEVKQGNVVTYIVEGKK